MQCVCIPICKQAHHNSALRTHLMIITDMTIRELITIPHGGVASLPPSFLVNQLQDLMARYLKQLTFPHNPLIQAETAWIYFPRQGRETSPRCGDHPNQVVFVHHIFCYHLIFNVRSCSTARTVSRCLTWGWVKIFTENICFSPWIHLVLFNLTFVLARCSAPTALERPSPTMLDTRSDRLPLLGLSVKISSTFNDKLWWSWWHLKI